WSTAAFEAQYGAHPAYGVEAAPLVMLTSAPPPPRDRTCRAYVAAPCTTPSTFTPTCSATATGSASRSGPIGSSTPALFTHRSTGPRAATTCEQNASTAAGSVTSTGLVTTRSSGAPGGGSGVLRAHRPTRIPSSTNRPASPAPSPRLAPVTTATEPWTSGRGSSRAPAGAGPTLLDMSRFEQAVVAVLQSLEP